MTTNEDIADALVLRRLSVLRYEQGVAADMIAQWDEYTEALIREAQRIQRRARNTKRPLTRGEKARLSAIRKELDAGLSDLREGLTDTLGSALQEVSETEGAAVAEAFRVALPEADPPDALAVAVVPPSDLARAISDPIGGRVWTARLAADLVEANGALSSVIARSVIEGASMPEAARALRDVSGIRETYRGRFTAIARTEVQRVANAAAADTYRANRDIVSGVQYLATLDSRTCLVCAPLHNQIIPLNPDGSLPVLIPGTPYHMPPVHPRCRCFLAPVVKPLTELGIDLRSASARDRLDGKKAINMDFDQWLKRQGAGVQNDILGPKRADLWRSGAVELEQFSDAGKVLSLGDLRARYPAMVPAA